MESNSSPDALITTAALAQDKHAGARALPPLSHLSNHHLVSSASASPRNTPPTSPGITLLDMYEIEWITRKLELLINSSSSSFSVSSPAKEPGDLHRMGKKHSCRKSLAFGSRFGRHATSLCGSNMEEVIETTSKREAKSRLSEVETRI